MAQWTWEAVVAQCFFAFGRGVGRDCDVSSDVFVDFYSRLDYIFRTVDLATWEQDRTVALEKWTEFGRRVGDERPRDFKGLVDIFVDVIHRVPTRYCDEAMRVLGARS